jgi:hypothetical protein
LLTRRAVHEAAKALRLRRRAGWRLPGPKTPRGRQARRDPIAGPVLAAAGTTAGRRDQTRDQPRESRPRAAHDLLAALARIGATIEAAGDRLVLRAGDTPIPSDLVARVRAARAELLTVLMPAHPSAPANPAEQRGELPDLFGVERRSAGPGRDWIPMWINPVTLDDLMRMGFLDRSDCNDAAHIGEAFSKLLITAKKVDLTADMILETGAVT